MDSSAAGCNSVDSADCKDPVADKDLVVDQAPVVDKALAEKRAAVGAELDSDRPIDPARRQAPDLKSSLGLKTDCFDLLAADRLRASSLPLDYWSADRAGAEERTDSARKQSCMRLIVR